MLTVQVFCICSETAGIAALTHSNFRLTNGTLGAQHSLSRQYSELYKPIEELFSELHQMTNEQLQVF
jgi:hypothetical protein